MFHFFSQVILPENVQRVMAAAAAVVVVQVLEPIERIDPRIKSCCFFRWTWWIQSTRFDRAIVLALQPLNLYL